MKKQKIIGIIVGCVIGALLIAGGVTAFAINYNISITPALQIMDTGSQVFVKTDANVDYEGYRFKFETEKDTFIIDSLSNVLELSRNDQILPGTKYKISVCYLGEIEGSNTVYSEPIDWVSYDYLRMSTITLQEEQKKIVWDAVTGADYYYVYNTTQTGSILQVNTNEIEFHSLPAGKQEIYVAAFSSKTFYKQSRPSNHVTVTVVQEYEPFLTLSLDVNQFILTGVSTQQYQKIQIFINNKSYIATSFTTKKLPNGQFEYNIHIAAIYTADATVEACPYPEDEFHSYHGEKTAAAIVTNV